MASASSFVGEIRAFARAVTNVTDSGTAIKAKWDALGGTASIAAHFLDSEGNPRTDIDITQDEIVAVITTINNLDAFMGAGNGTNLYKAQ